MIRNIAGIMADGEPKTPVSPSGLYDSSMLKSLDPDYDLSSPSLAGLSEFTFMLWAYIYPSNPTNYTLAPYTEYGNGGGAIKPLGISENRINCNITNTVGTTYVESVQSPKQNEWVHYCVTGSVSNNRIRIYENGVLLNSAVMTYSNSSKTDARINDINGIDIAQLNIYDRELTEAQVAEHYVYDDDTMTSGVLGFDAMTPAQKNRLIYSASFIEDVSIAGGEFNDKSGSNITLSPQPSLTGQQIYVYTDASDLPVSPSGLYNSSDLGSLPSNGILSSTLTSGASELTFMMWISVDDFSIYSSTGARPFVDFNPTSYPISLGSTGVAGDFSNSNGGKTTVVSIRPFLENNFYHICVTQSLLNNRIRIYVDGVLESSATMSYPNVMSQTTANVQKQDGVYISQFNVFDRELSESEVAEHYVYDDDLMQSGVLGFNAMTPAQKSGLIYSSSFTEDISIAGGEFNDKSGSNITLSPQPSLTGEQIYVYTDASDLPSTPQIYNVNSATLNGSSQYYSYPTDQSISASGSGSFRYIVRPTNIGSKVMIHGMRENISNYLQIKVTSIGLSITNWFNGTLLLNETLTYSFTNNTWYDIVLSQSSGTLTLYVNGSLVGNFTAGIDTSYTSPTVEYGAYSPAVDYFQGQMSLVSFHENYTLSQSDVTSLYNGDTPLCYDSWDSGLKTNTEFMANLATWTGSNVPVTDQTGNGNDLTAFGSPTYTNQGLSVECTN